MTDNALEMSDEEFMNTPFESFAVESSNLANDTEEDKEPESEQTDIVEESEENNENDSETDSEEDKVEESDDTDDSKEGETVDESTEEESEEESTEKPTESTLDVQAELDKLFKPFKANGKDMSVKSVDEAIQLMQMGANYGKKMTALKPGLKVLRMLENNGLMNESDVSFLIDLNKKNPEAIAKLLKDSEINPLEVDLDRSIDYKGGNHIIDDAQLNVEEVLDSIKDTPTYKRTIEVVGKEWDATSRQTIAENPSIITEINNHIKDGIYDQIQSEIDKLRMFGQLKGVSDLVAYKQVGDMLNAQGKFDAAPDQSKQQKPEVKPKTNSNDPKIKAKKQAAGITKSGKATESKPDDDFNPLALSDEEFEKRFGNKL
ncbi:MAG: hypothetical protein CMC55_06080 [Flavobacteriaceae bacterium]|nr:hypothetical protein [Flavobacteriaceae bacterium]